MLNLLVKSTEDVTEVHSSFCVMTLFDMFAGKALEIVELLYPLPHTTQLSEITSATYHQQRLIRQERRTTNTPTHQMSSKTAQQRGLVSQELVDQGSGGGRWDGEGRYGQRSYLC